MSRAGARALRLLCAPVAVALMASGCGSDATETTAGAASDVTTVTSVRTVTTTATTTVPATSASTAPATTAGDPGGPCSDQEEPNGLGYTVSNIPADDPDGGLVVLSDAGVGNPRLAVLPAGTPVTTTDDPATCVIVADGGVWWRVAYSGGRGWVNSRYLRQSADQAEANRAEVCRLYQEVLTYELASGDFAPEALTAELNAALNAPPPGVTDALRRISSPADETDLADAYTTVKSYVGPICA